MSAAPDVGPRIVRPWLHALGDEGMPVAVELAGESFRHRRTFKHDFYAATGLYEGRAGRRVVLKLGRRRQFFGMPLRWFGRLMIGHERRLYALVHDLDGIPRYAGDWGEAGFAHEYVEGHPLQPGERVREDFFDELEALVRELHARGIACADLEKRENTLVDLQGRPHLIDFQISWHWPLRGEPRAGVQRFLPDAVGRWIFHRLCTADRYHLGKQRRRHDRHRLSREEIEATRELPAGVRFHRRFVLPIIRLRRHALRLLTGSPRSPKQDGPEFLDSLERARAPVAGNEAVEREPARFDAR